MTITAELVAITIGALGGLIGGLIWLIRMEGRVNAVEERIDRHLGESREVWRDFHRKLDRMESKLDRITLNCAAYNHVRELRRVPSEDEDGA